MCLGRKFAEAEFTACIAVLLRKHKVDIALMEGETREQAKRRVEAAVQNSGGHLALVMQEDVGLILLDR